MTKQTKSNKEKRIAELERKLQEALAAQVHVYHFADAELERASKTNFGASGVIVTITALGGRQVMQPVLIREGLSAETIRALRADIVRSYNDAVVFKPDTDGW